jgi:hypothetical protein
MREHNTDGSVHLFRLRFTAQPDVWRWALLLGDTLHNLRCALDHLVYALAVRQTGKDPPDDDRALMFPICSNPEHWNRSKRRIASLNEATQAAIERVQPYNRLKAGQWFMPLWWLAQLNDIDKHRLPHIAVVAAHHDEINIAAEPGAFRALWNQGALRDGAVLLQLYLDKPDPELYVELKATGGVVLQLQDLPLLGLQQTVFRIRYEVGIICRYLSQFGC